ncbi:MAG: alpha-glucan family phosphorylase [Patescibacteria group bacterium]|nr:alpha-glucan family phosphorylase [Patescibacteria group bacterium]
MENNQNPVVYLSAEFGIDNNLPTYSGGLGILAADTLNEAANQEFPMIGIGILYKGKEYIQHITSDGKMETRDSDFDHDSSFLRAAMTDGKPIVITIDLENYKVLVKAYKIRLSQKVILYFLSSDVDGNPPEWISDMDTLYGGDINSQIRQQILLGIGGAKLIKALGITPSVYHINEGRPCFIVWELVSELMRNEKISYSQALERVKSKIVYTNHTLVAAGNLTYPVSTLDHWAAPFARAMGVDTNFLIKEGLINPETFSITKYALNISKIQSAVSKIHGEYCKKQWPEYNWIPITNGVQMNRWQDSDFRNPNLTDRQIWDLHMIKKRELESTVIKRTGIGYDPERLVIVWARRLADYKQPQIIFSDLDRIKSILKNPLMPIQLLFAGNSHTGDAGAKSIIESIIKLFATELNGHAIFIPNYNISLANHLVSGADVWLNTPQGGLEACGTSGMKALANGVLQCTVIDGWTHEVNWDGIGWTLEPTNIAENFYNTLEFEIAPTYYKKNQNGLPIEWIVKMKKSINIARNFSTERMLKEYFEFLYKPIDNTLCFNI